MLAPALPSHDTNCSLSQTDTSGSVGTFHSRYRPGKPSTEIGTGAEALRPGIVVKAFARSLTDGPGSKKLFFQAHGSAATSLTPQNIKAISGPSWAK